MKGFLNIYFTRHFVETPLCTFLQNDIENHLEYFIYI
jgi:hypothetical protein